MASGSNGGDETLRVVAVRRTGLLDMPPDQELSKICQGAAQAMDVPVALISIVDEDRQFFASASGGSHNFKTGGETPLALSLCWHVVNTGSPLILRDVHLDPKFQNHPAVRDLSIAAYAGVPIRVGQHVIGTVCALDVKSHDWTEAQVMNLYLSADAVTSYVASRAEQTRNEALSATPIAEAAEPMVLDLSAAAAFYLAQIDAYLRAVERETPPHDARRAAVIGARANLMRAFEVYDARPPQDEAGRALRDRSVDFLNAEQNLDRVSLRFRRQEASVEEFEAAAIAARDAEGVMRLALYDHQQQTGLKYIHD